MRHLLALALCLPAAAAAADLDGDGVPTPLDCDDTDAHVFPGAHEHCHDGVDQDCNGLDDCFELVPPATGTPLGQPLRWSVVGATPHELVKVVVSQSPGMTPIPSCPGLMLDLAGGIVIGTARTDALGQAVVDAFVPQLFAGRTVYEVAVDVHECHGTHAEPHTF